jgi:hypothetical protein
VDTDATRALAAILTVANLPSAEKLRDVLRQFVSSGLWNTKYYGTGLNDSYDVSVSISITCTLYPVPSMRPDTDPCLFT